MTTPESCGLNTEAELAQILANLRNQVTENRATARAKEAAEQLVSLFGCNNNNQEVSRQIAKHMREIRSLLKQAKQASDSKPQEPRQQGDGQDCAEPLLRHELTLRHVFAAQALTGLLASNAPINSEDAAQRAWQAADDMMQVLADRRVRGLHN